MNTKTLGALGLCIVLGLGFGWLVMRDPAQPPATPAKPVRPPGPAMPPVEPEAKPVQPARTAPSTAKPTAAEPPPAKSVPSTTDHFRTRFLDWATLARKAVKTPEEEAAAKQEAKDLSQDLYTKQEVQDAFVQAFGTGSMDQAVMLWDVGFGTYCDNQLLVDVHRNPVPHFRDALWGLFQKLGDDVEGVQRKSMIFGILLKLEDPRATPDLGADLEKKRNRTP